MANRWPHTILVVDLGNRIFTEAVPAGTAASLPAPAFRLNCNVAVISDESSQPTYTAHGGTFIAGNRNNIRFEIATSKNNYANLILNMVRLRQQNLDNGYVRSVLGQVPFILTNGLPNINGTQPQYLYLQVQADVEAPNDPFRGYSIANLRLDQLLDPFRPTEERLNMTFESVRIRPDKVTINSQATVRGT